MANTLTGLIRDIYTAADRVAREQVGFLPAAYRNSSGEQVAKDQPIVYPIAPTQTASDYTPAMTLPNPDGQTVNNGSMTISKIRTVQIPWSGEEQASLGDVYETVQGLQLEGGFRVLANEVEADLAAAVKAGSSRAYGTAGTTPFATAGDFTDFASMRQILIDNGAPKNDMHLVLNTTASTKLLGKQSNLFKVNEAGDESMLRDGNLGRIEGLTLHESGQITTHTKGTGTSYVVNGAHAVDATSLVAKTGSGTILAGDVIALEDDTRKYVVNTGITAPGTMVLGAPGLKQAQTDGKTITVGNSYLGSFAFDRNAVHVLTRLPMMPKGGDAARDMVEITDPYSGLVFRVSLYAGRGMNVITIDLAWGVKVVKPAFVATLLG